MCLRLQGSREGLTFPFPRRCIPFSPGGLRIRVRAPPFTCLPTSLGVLADQMSAPISHCSLPDLSHFMPSTHFSPTFHTFPGVEGALVILQFKSLIHSALLSTCCISGPVMGAGYIEITKENTNPALKTVTIQGNLGFKNRELLEYRRGSPSSGWGVGSGRPLGRETFELSAIGPREKGVLGQTQHIQGGRTDWQVRP